MNNFKYKEIPQNVFLYLGFEKLSYLRYLTIFTLSQLNPDWKINLYKPTYLTKNITWQSGENARNYNGKCYLEKVRNLNNVDVTEFDFESINISNSLPEVHKSDFLQWHLLHSVGGIWSDTDILYFRPLSNLNKLSKREDITCFYCYDPILKIHSIGFNIAAKGDTFYTLINNSAKNAYKKDSYECIGSILLSNLDKHSKYSQSLNLPMEIVYPINGKNIPRIYQDINDNFTTEKTIGIHWYAGSSISFAFENFVNETNFLNENNTLTKKYV